MPTVILLDIAILFTALVDKKAYLFVSLAWAAVVAAPVPLDILLLWYVLRRPRKMFQACTLIWAIYIAFHVLLSVLFRYDSLIPAWRLHS